MKDAAAPPCRCQETHLPAATCLWLPPRARGPQRACRERGAGRQPGYLAWSVRQNTSAAGTRRSHRPQQPDTAGTAAARRKDMGLKDFSLVFPRLPWEGGGGSGGVVMFRCSAAPCVKYTDSCSAVLPPIQGSMKRSIGPKDPRFRGSKEKMQQITSLINTAKLMIVLECQRKRTQKSRFLAFGRKGKRMGGWECYVVQTQSGLIVG